MNASCCSICYEIFEPGREMMYLKCGHMFHEECLNKWQKESRTCPQCRQHACNATQINPEFTTTPEEDLMEQRIQREKDESLKKLTTQRRKIQKVEKLVNSCIATSHKQTSALREEKNILEERIEDLLRENSSMEVTHLENINKMEKSNEELQNLVININERTELTECFQRKNSDLQTQLEELEAENNFLKEQIRTNELPTKSALKRKRSNKRTVKFVVEPNDLVDDTSVSDDDN